MSTFYRRLRLAFLLLFAVVALGTAGYRMAGLSWLDALYQTVITISTVGYRDLAEGYNVKPLTIFLVGFGTLSVAVLLSILTAAIVELQIRDILGRRKMEKTVRQLDQHVILCGFGRFGRTIAAELSRKRIPFVVLELDAGRGEWASEHGYPVLQSDATEEESLTLAGIERSQGLLTTLGSDAANVYVTLTAKQMNRGIKVVAIALDEHAERKLMAAGADEVVSPYQIGGTWMAHAIASPTAADFLKMATGMNPINFYMDEQRIGSRSKLRGLKLKDTPIRSEYGAIVVGVRGSDGTLTTNPNPDLTLNEGDVLVSLGGQDELTALKELAEGP